MITVAGFHQLLLTLKEKCCLFVVQAFAVYGTEKRDNPLGEKPPAGGYSARISLEPAADSFILDSGSASQMMDKKESDVLVGLQGVPSVCCSVILSCCHCVLCFLLFYIVIIISPAR